MRFINRGEIQMVLIVNDSPCTVSKYEPNAWGLLVSATVEIAAQRKQSREEVAVALGKKVAEQKKKAEQSRIQKH